MVVDGACVVGKVGEEEMDEVGEEGNEEEMGDEEGEVGKEEMDTQACNYLPMHEKKLFRQQQIQNVKTILGMMNQA